MNLRLPTVSASELWRDDGITSSLSTLQRAITIDELRFLPAKSSGRLIPPSSRLLIFYLCWANERRDGSGSCSGATQLCFLGGRSMIAAMQEVLSRTAEMKAPLQEQEFYELSMLEESNQLGTRYCVRQAHAEWSDIDGQIMWDQEEVEHFWILDEAKRRYAERRLVLAQGGFIYSDMDLF